MTVPASDILYVDIDISTQGTGRRTRVTLTQADDQLVWLWPASVEGPGPVALAQLICAEARNRGSVHHILMDRTGIAWGLYEGMAREVATEHDFDLQPLQVRSARPPDAAELLKEN